MLQLIARKVRKYKENRYIAEYLNGYNWARRTVSPEEPIAGNWGRVEYVEACTEDRDDAFDRGAKRYLRDVSCDNEIVGDFCEDEGCPHHGTVHVCIDPLFISSIPIPRHLPWW